MAPVVRFDPPRQVRPIPPITSSSSPRKKSPASRWRRGQQVQRALAGSAGASDEGRSARRPAHRTRHADEATRDAKFNLVGPDMSASEWADLLKPLVRPSRLRRHDVGQLPVHAETRGSRPYRGHGDGFDGAGIRNGLRGVVRQGADRNGGRQPTRTAACRCSRRSRTRARRVRRWYDEHNQLPTERPLIDDDGDGVGREAQSQGADGSLARGTYLQAAGEPVDAPRRALAARQTALEAQVERAQSEAIVDGARRVSGGARTPAARTCTDLGGAAFENLKSDPLSYFTSWTKSFRTRCAARARTTSCGC